MGTKLGGNLAKIQKREKEGKLKKLLLLNSIFVLTGFGHSVWNASLRQDLKVAMCLGMDDE